MARPLSFMPAGRRSTEIPPAGVARRRVLYVPGYDPEGETRYRMLFVREAIRYARRFGLKRPDISRVSTLPDLPGLRWTVRAGTEAWATETTYDVLRWDDLVRRDFRRPLPGAVLMLIVTVIYAAVTGMFAGMFRINGKMGAVALYPFVVILLVAMLALGAGWGADALLSWLGTGGRGARWALVAGIAGLSFCAFYPLGERWFVWHLLHDVVFNFQHGTGLRNDCAERIERFAEHLLTAARDEHADEVLVVGHSSGSQVAVETVARALERDPGIAEGRTRLALLTIGSCVPLIGLNPAARRFRERVAALMTHPGLFWAEYQAPQDWINFAGFEPRRDLRLAIDPARCVNPVVRSARFREIVEPRTYRTILYRPFRMHFQFLMANDRPGEYDYVMMVVGPCTLAGRVLAAAASEEPGRRPCEVDAAAPPGSAKPATAVATARP